MLGKQAEEKHSIVDCCCEKMQLSGNAADWGAGECTAAEISVAQILQEDQLGGELANYWLLAGEEIQLSGSSPDWGVVLQ